LQDKQKMITFVKKYNYGALTMQLHYKVTKDASSPPYISTPTGRTTQWISPRKG